MKDFIYNQKECADARYGLRSSAQVGCGWVAVWNALKILGYSTDKAALIRYFTWMLPGIHGNLGTAFWAPERCFRQWGFPTKLVFDRKNFDETLRQGDAAILFYHWAGKSGLGAHFAALERTPAGIIGYNTYRDSRGPDSWGESLEEFIRSRGYFGCVLLEIWKKDEKNSGTENKETNGSSGNSDGSDIRLAD